MKNFEFIIKKVLENKVAIKAKDKKDALEKIIELLSNSNEYLFENSDKNNQVFEIKLYKATSDFKEKNEEKAIPNDQELEKLINKIIKQIKEDIVESYLEDCIADDELDNELLEEKDTGIEDDLPKEYGEIVCEKCGNCIVLDKDLLS